MQAYIQKLGTCLLAVEEHHTEEADQALTKLSKEAAALVCCMCHFNSDTVKVLYGLRLDDGQPVQHQPGDAFYCQLVVRFCQKRKEKATSYGVSFMRSPVTYWTAQM